MFAGRLERQKNVELLLDAFADLSAERSDVALVILGDGDLRAGLEARAEELGLSSTVSFTGRIENAIDYLAAGDAFVLPSIAEGLSNALLEAMSLGAISIASRVSGSVDVIAPQKNGILFDAGSKDGLLAAMRSALNLSPEARQNMSAAAERTVKSDYTMDSVRSRYEALYRDMTAQRQ